MPSHGGVCYCWHGNQVVIGKIAALMVGHCDITGLKGKVHSEANRQWAGPRGSIPRLFACFSSTLSPGSKDQYRHTWSNENSLPSFRSGRMKGLGKWLSLFLRLWGSGLYVISFWHNKQWMEKPALFKCAEVSVRRSSANAKDAAVLPVRPALTRAALAALKHLPAPTSPAGS